MFRRILSHPWLNIVLILAITLFFGLQLPKTELDNDLFKFLPKDHPAYVSYKEAEKIFGSTLLMDVVIESKDGTILSDEGIELVRSLTEEFEEIEYAEEVTSLTNTDYIIGTPEGMEAIPLVGDEAEENIDIQEIKNRILSWDIYRRLLISDDFSSTQIAVTLHSDTPADGREHIFNRLQEILKQYERENFDFYLAGLTAVEVLINTNMQLDLSTLIPIVVVVVLIVLFLSFKRFSGMALPMITVIISTVWAIGLMSLLHIPLSVVGTVIPVLMVAVGSAYGIHVISHYYDELREKKEDISYTEKKELVLATLKKVGKPVFMAGLTTMAGFGSLVVSRVSPMRDFGIFTAIGVGAAVIIALTFIPSLFLIKKSGKKVVKKRRDSRNLVECGLEAYHRFFTKRQGAVIVLFVLVIGTAVFGATKLVVDDVLIEYFKEDTDIRISDKIIGEKFAGTNSLDIVVEGKKDGDATNPELLVAMEDLGEYLSSRFPQVTKVVSFTDLVRRMNQVMHVDEGAAGDWFEERAVGQDFALSGEGTESFFTEGGDQDVSSFFDDEETFESFFSEEEKKDAPAQEVAQEESDESESYTPSLDLSTSDFMKTLYETYAALENRNIDAEEFIDYLARQSNYQGKAFDEIPKDPQKYGLATKEDLQNLISQYLVLVSGNIDEWADDPIEPRIVKMTLYLDSPSTLLAARIEADAREYIQKHFPKDYTVKISGEAIASKAVTDLSYRSSISSILVSLFLVSLIVAFHYRSIVAGLIGLIPLSTTVLVNFGFMGFTGIRLDMPTAMVGSIAIGIGIDYTIHFIAGYKREREKSSDPVLVTRNTLVTSGKAIIYNALSVAAGFAVLMLSQFVPLQHFGLLIMITMLVSSVASLTILPVILNITQPRFLTR